MTGIAFVRMAEATDGFVPFKPLETAYTEADAIVLAKVSGCAGAVPSDHGQCAGERYRLACSIHHAMDGAALSFSFVYTDADYYRSHRMVLSIAPDSTHRLDSEPGTPPESSLHATLTGPYYGHRTLIFRLSQHHPASSRDGSASIRIGDRVWPLYREAVQ